MDDVERARAVARQREVWRRDAPSYDRKMGLWERVLFEGVREWVCSRAAGEVLEIAVGTGRNLPHYPPGVRLPGIDLSPEMLAIARERSQEAGQEVTLQQGDAHDLDFDDDSFDTVVCALSLCTIPDRRRALEETRRVLRPGGRLLLVDHVASTNPLALGLQRILEKLTFRRAAEHLTRRSLPLVVEVGFSVEEHERDRLGIVERVAARA